jgi:HK97 gp10 family phage protein
MARNVTLVNRFPRIMAELGPKVNLALLAGAEQIAQDARGRVPVESGSLRDAIHVDSDHDGHLVVAGDNDVFYGHFVEFGTSNNAAHPFLIPATESNRDNVIELVAGALRSL